MKSFPPATRGDPIRRHLTSEWINTINAMMAPEEAPGPGSVNGGYPAPLFALVRVDSTLTGAEVYRGVFNPFRNRSVSGSAATHASNWFDDHVGDCAIVNWGGDGTGHDLAAGSVVPAIRFGCINIDGTRLLPAYHVGGVGGSESSGEYQGMIHKMVSDNQDGWDFFTAHPVP